MSTAATAQKATKRKPISSAQKPHPRLERLAVQPRHCRPDLKESPRRQDGRRDGQRGDQHQDEPVRQVAGHDDCRRHQQAEEHGGSLQAKFRQLQRGGAPGRRQHRQRQRDRPETEQDAQPARQRAPACKQTGYQASRKQGQVEELSPHCNLPGRRLRDELDVFPKVEAAHDQTHRTVDHPGAEVAGETHQPGSDERQPDPGCLVGEAARSHLGSPQLAVRR